MSKWIAVAERLPSYRDGKGRDNSVIGWMTDKVNDYTFAGACSVSVSNVEDWVKAGKCSHWRPLPDAPDGMSDGTGRKKCTHTACSIEHSELCSDCPPPDYPDTARCVGCPRRGVSVLTHSAGDKDGTR